MMYLIYEVIYNGWNIHADTREQDIECLIGSHFYELKRQYPNEMFYILEV